MKALGARRSSSFERACTLLPPNAALTTPESQHGRQERHTHGSVSLPARTASNAVIRSRPQLRLAITTLNERLPQARCQRSQSEAQASVKITSNPQLLPL